MGYSAGQVIKGIVCQNIAGSAFKAMMDEATFLLGLDARGTFFLCLMHNLNASNDYYNIQILNISFRMYVVMMLMKKNI